MKKPLRRHRPQALTLTVNTGATWLCDSVGHHSDPFCDWAAKRCWTESEINSRMEVFSGDGLSIDDQLRAGVILLLQVAEPLGQCEHTGRLTDSQWSLTPKWPGPGWLKAQIYQMKIKTKLIKINFLNVLLAGGKIL